MSGYIVNAAPMVYQLGIQDLSTTQLARQAEAIPQHCPKFFLFTKKGPTSPQLVVGDERIRMFGEESFDVRGIYANHATVFANLINAQGNSCMIQRVIPEDAGPAANITIWLDVLPTTVDVYERNSDGSIKRDSNDDPIVTGTADGYKVKFVRTFDSADVNLANFGAAKISAGDQVDSTTGTQSQRYPIFELKATARGAYGNNAGFRIWAPSTDNASSLPTEMMAKKRAYPYHFSMIERDDSTSSAEVVETQFGEQYTMVTLKPGVIDPSTDKQLYMGDVLIDSYQNVSDVRYPIVLGNFGTLVIYQNNLNTLLGLFHAKEKAYIDTNYDFSESADDIHLFNFISGTTSNAYPYHTYQFVDDTTSVRLTQYTDLYAAGGSDGTMNNDTHAALVIDAMDDYLNPDSELQDVAYHVESIMYDSGFPLAAKYALTKFISVRKDTSVALTTYTDGAEPLTASEEYSLAIALRTRLQNYPESDYYGTPVTRGIVVGCSGKLRNSQWTSRVPVLAEIAIKSAKYMGSGNGAWKNGSNFDGAPGSVLDYVYDVSIPWVPSTTRNKYWDAGLNWVGRYDRKNFFFPALKTVYDDDTSVLNSFFTMVVCCTLNKFAHAVWREHTGISGLTPAQFKDKVESFARGLVKDKFDGRYVIEPECVFTDMDTVRGYAWHFNWKLYSPNMYTVMTTTTKTYRISDLSV